MRRLLVFLFLLSLSSQMIYADVEPNNDCATEGELITAMNNISADTSHVEGPGSFVKNADATDIYYFQINAAGTLNFYLTTANTIDVYIGTSGCGSETQVIANAADGDSTNVNISSSGTVIIRLEGKNDDYQYGFDLQFKLAVSPTANDDNVQTLQDNAIAIDVTSNDTDDGSIDKTTVTVVSGPSHGTATVNATTGVVTYTPDTGYNGTDYFDYTVKDNLGNVSNTANVTIVVKVPTQSVENCDTGTQNDYRDFCLRKQVLLPGNMLTIGNTVLVAPDEQNSTICSTYTNGSYIDNAPNTNDDYYLCQYHIDGAGTPPATAATVTFPDANNSEIEWAGLYWQALVPDTTDLTAMQIKIKNGTDAYATVGYDKLNYLGSGFSGTYSYAAFKDVTTVLTSNNWKDGNYTVADIPVYEGKYNTLGTFGAWSLVIIYKNASETIRSFSVFDGYKKVGVSGSTDVPIGISGFYTPKAGDIHSSVSVFTGEGDKNFDGDTLTVVRNSDNTQVTLPVGSTNSFNSGIDNTSARTPNPTNNQGIDIHTYQLGTDGVNVLSYQQSDITFHFKSNLDQYWPSMLAFTSEVYTPSFCYDYAYQQNGVYITEENNDTLRAPRITGFVTDGDDLNVTLYIRNQEDSDVTAKNLSLDILDINTTQAIYKSNTVSILNPSEVVPLSIPDSNLAVSNSYIKNIQYADVAGKEHIYTYYTLTPNLPASLDHEMNISLNGTFTYDLVLPLPSGGEVTIPSSSTLGGTNLPLCSGGNFEYVSQADWSIFNVVDSNIYATGEKYNIPTQVVRRPGNFSVVAYDENVSGFTTADTNSTTLVGIDMIDAGAFHDIQATCSETTAGISPILWMNFEGSSTINLNQEIIDAIADDRLDIASINDFFPNAVKSAAFRISYITLADGSGDLVKTEPAGGDNLRLLNFTELVQDIGTCKQPVKKFPNSDLTTINVPVACANAGAVGISPFEMQRCLECLFGYNTHHICSRDNFSIRPESLLVKINDSNQSIGASTRLADNRTGVAAPNTSPLALSAGYDYLYEINATSHTGNEATPGYSRYFNPFNASDYNISLIWSPSDPAVNPFCNDISNAALAFNVIDGKLSVSTALAKHDNVGEYRLNAIDKTWTQVDWDPAYMQHHADSTYYIGGLSGKDCVENSSSVLATGAAAVVSGGVLSNINGCNIDSNNHDNAEASIKYRDYNLSFHPYDFNLSTVTFNKGMSNTVIPANTSSYVYMNDILNDSNMSLRYSGQIKAVGANTVPLNNFVAGCYAKDIDLTLNTSSLPATPDYNYRLRENNSSGLVFSDTNGTNGGAAALAAAIIPAGNFTKGLFGISDMEFNFNFDRNVTGAMNPLTVTYNDFNVSCTVPADCESSADMSATHKPDSGINSNVSVTHIYGRVHTPRQRVADPDPATPATTTNNIPLYYEFYCDTTAGCVIGDYAAAPALSPIGLLSPDDVRWYRQDLHDINIDGNATTTQARSAADNLLLTTHIINPGAQSATYTYNGNKGYPYKATIELSAPQWLIYNRYNANALVNDFELEFFTTGQWAGKDASQMGLDANASTNVNRRVEW